MTPKAVLRLVTAMRDDPSLGIIQHLTVGLPASSAFPRLFQFGMRAGMRTWATALDAPPSFPPRPRQNLSIQKLSVQKDSSPA